MLFPVVPHTVLPLLLLLQAALGAIDTIYNHELREHLSRRPEARNEIGLHAGREAIYGLLFGIFAWFDWPGAWVWTAGALVVVLVGIDMADEVLENRTRILPHGERGLHFLMTLGLGVTVAFMIALVLDQAAHPDPPRASARGIVSWALALASLGALSWSLRDLVAWHRLGRLATARLT